MSVEVSNELKLGDDEWLEEGDGYVLKLSAVALDLLDLVQRVSSPK